MKHMLIAVFALTLLGAGVAIAFSANAGRQSCRDRGIGMVCTDAKAPTISITGTVQTVSTPDTGQPGPVTLTVTAGNDSHRVMIGPSRFVSSLNLSLKSGDQLTITGWSITCQGTPVIVVRGLTMAGKTYSLRDTSGKPIWAGNQRSGTACDPASCKQSCPAATCDECPMQKKGASCRRSSGCRGGNASDSTTPDSPSASQ